MADVEANVDITVEGADSLAAAAAEAEALKEALDADRDAAGEAGAAIASAGAEGAAGMDAAAASAAAAKREIGGVRDASAESATAAGAEAAATAGLAAARKEAAAQGQRLRDAKGRFTSSGDRYAGVDKQLNPPGEGKKSAGDVKREMEDLQKAIRSANIEAGGASVAGHGALEKYATDLERLKADIADAEPRIDAMNGAIGKSADKASIASTALGNWHGALRDFGSGHGDAATAKRAAGELDGVLGDFGKTTQDAARGLGDLSSGLGDAEKAGSGLAGLFGGASSILGMGGGAGSGAGGAGGALMPLGITALVSAITTIGPVLLATGAGFASWGALAAPALSKVKTGLTSVTAAQKAYQKASAVEQVDPTKAHAASEKAALDSLKATWATIPANVRPSVQAIQGLEHAFSQAGKPIQADALKDIPKAITDIKGLLPSVQGLAKATNPLISGMLSDFGKFEKSSGFKGFVSSIKSEIPAAVGPLKTLGNALGSVMTELFSKKNMQAGNSLITSTAGLVKAFGPGAVNQLTQGAKILSGINHTLTDWSKPGQALNNFGKHWDQTVSLGEAALNNGRQHTNQLMSANRTAGKAIADFFTPHFSLSHGVTWDYSNLKTPVPTANVTAQQMQGARALAQGGTPAPAGKKGAAAQAGTLSVTEKVKVDTSGAKSELASLSHYKMQDAKIKVAVSGADTAKTAFQGVVTAGQQAGTKAGAAIGTGIQSGQGKATSAATAVAGGVKGAVAPLPGQLQSTGAAAGAGMAAGISSETGAVTAAASALAAAAESAAKVHLQVSSPSKVFKKIGQNTVLGYILGLEGGKSAVQAAMRLVLGTKPPDATIKSTVTAITKEIDLAAKAGQINPLQKMGLTQLLDQDNGRLQKLATQRAKIESQIAAADALAKSVQQAAVQSADLNTIAAATPAGIAAAAAANPASQQTMGTDAGTGGPATIQEGLQAQLKSIQNFRQQIIKLKKDGLDKQGIQELLAAGVQQGGATATQMLAGGKKAVQQIAQLDNSIGLASKKLGITGGNAAYEGASQIGGQLAAGLKASLKAVNTEMASIAKSLVTGIMAALGDSSKQIKAAIKKLDKELGIDSGAGSGGSAGSKGKVTAPHIIYSPKPTQGPGGFKQPGPIRAPQPVTVMHPAVMSGASGGSSAPINVTLNATITVDGQTLANVVQTQTLKRARRNVSNGLALPNGH